MLNKREKELLQIEEEISTLYKTKVPVTVSDVPSVIVGSPVQVGSEVISLSTIISPESLPPLDEYLKDFAFRFSLEPRPLKFFAGIYGVGIETIRRWLRDPVIQTYIAACRKQVRLNLYAKNEMVKNQLYKRIMELLTIRINSENISSIVSLVKFLYTAYTNPDSLKRDTKVLIQNLGGVVNTDIPSNTLPNEVISQNTNQRFFTEEEIEKRIEELEAIQESLDDESE